MAIFGIGGEKSSGKSSTDQSAFDFSQTKQSLAFADLFGGMYGNAATKAAGITGAQTGTAAQQLFSTGSQFLQNLMGGGPGSSYLANRVTGPDQVLGSQMDTLRGEMGRLFTEELNPAITSNAVGSRGLGGGRQGVAQGVAMSGLGREFSRGIVELMGQSQGQRDAAAGTLATGEAARAGVGLGSLESMLGIARGGESSGLLGTSLLAEIMGGPTTLTDSVSFGQSQSKSRSKQQSAGFNLGFG